MREELNTIPLSRAAGQQAFVSRDRKVPSPQDTRMGPEEETYVTKSDSRKERAPMTQAEIQAAHVGPVKPLTGPIQIVAYDP